MTWRFDPSSSGSTTRLGATAALLFAVGVAVQDATRQGFDPLRHMVSHLSLGPGGWINAVLIFATGCLLAAFGLGLKRSGFPGGKAVPVLVVLAGLALVAAAIFPIDPGLGYPPGEPAVRTWKGSVHDAAGGVLFLSLTGAALVTARKLKRRPEWRRLRRASLLAVILIPALFAACSIAVGLDYGGAAERPLGELFERLYLAAAFAWILLLSVSAAQHARSARALPSRAHPAGKDVRPRAQPS